MTKAAAAELPIVLIVDDEPLLRMNAADLLEDAGFATVEASNASEALVIMEATPEIHVLFTDIQMPGPMDGMELARRIHSRWPGVLLLITSGNMRPKTIDIPDHGHFLSKPYGAAKLIVEIRTLEREAAARL